MSYAKGSSVNNDYFPAYSVDFNNLNAPLTNQYGMPYVSSHDDEYASKTYANLIKGEYRDYQSRFKPYEQQLLGYASGTELLDQQLSRISANIGMAYNNPQMSAGNLMQQRYGLTQTAQGQASSQRQNDLQRAISTAHARNNTRIASYDQQMGIVTGANTARSLTTNQINGG